MPKAPKEKPSVGHTVKLRGREPFGMLCLTNDRGWCAVKWDVASPRGPKLVHIDELECAA